MKKDLLTIKDLTKDEVKTLISRALEMKRNGRDTGRPLRGYTMGLIFDKASTRTRVSFETAMFRLGGDTLFMRPGDTQLSRDEPVSDTARVLSRYLDALVIRTYSQELVEELARWADIPVINALTDRYHPCQILSDLVTVAEAKGDLEGLRIAWIGDGNNVARSWINAAAVVGFELVLACPSGFAPGGPDLDAAGRNVQVVEDPAAAARGADVVNTDVWISMGQDDERDRRMKAFQGFQVEERLMALAKPDAIFMHCLPAHRGEEVSAGVLEGAQSVVFDQAENKMHLHQALLESLILRK